MSEEGGDASPGLVTAPAGAAVLVEGDSFRVQLSQGFALPLRPDHITFSVDTIPGFDPDTSFIPDAFEARLVDAAGQTVIPPWMAGSTAFFNLQEDGTFHAAPGVQFDGTYVTVDVSDLAAGRSVVLVFDLIGGDAGTSSGVTIDAVDVGSRNGAPVANAGPDATVECDSLPATLDGSGSVDPDGDALSYLWWNDQDELVSESVAWDVSPPLGEATWTLRVVDPLGASSSDTVTLDVVDTKGPTVTRPAGPLSVDVDGTCAGFLPDIVALSSASDACGDATLTQDPPAGSSFAAGATVTVHLLATDDVGNTTRRNVDVVFVDPTGTCVIVDTGGGGPGGPGGADTSDTADTDLPADTDVPVDTDLPTDTDADTDRPTDTDADTDLPTDTDADTDRPTDTDRPSDTDDTDDNPTATDDHNGNASDDTDDDYHPDCGCGTTGGVGSTAPLGALALMLGLARRRRRGVRPVWTALLMALFATVFVASPARAADPEPLTLGAAVSGQVAVAGEVDRFTFTATAGQYVFVDAVSTDNFWNTTWRLVDRYGRVLASSGVLADLGRVRLMGGEYTVEVSCVGSATSSYSFRVTESALVDEGVAALDTDVHGVVVNPGEQHTHTLHVPAHAKAYLNVLEASAFWSTGLRLTDAHGLVVWDATNMSDPGLLALQGGDYTVTVYATADVGGTYTFRLDTVQDDTGTLTVGGSATGALSGPGDSDTWTFSASSAQPFALVFTGVTNYWSNRWRIVDAYGQEVLGQDQLADRAPITLATGTYKLVVRGDGDAVGAYTVRLGALTDLTGTTTVGTAKTSTFTEVGQTATYTFTASAGERVAVQYVSSTGLSLWDVGFVIRDATGTAVWGPTTNMPWYGAVTLAGGTYTVTIDPTGSAVGAVTWKLADVVTSSTPLVLGSLVSGEISTPGETDLYTFSAAAGSLLDLTYVASSAPYNLHYRLRDSVGRDVLARTGELLTRAGIALAGGSYTLEITADGDVTGTYSFTPALNGVSSFTSSGTPAALGSVVTGAVATVGVPVDTRLDLATAKSVFFDLQTGSGGAVWTLLDPAGGVVFGPAPAADTWWHDVGPLSLNPGAYTLRLDATSLPAAFSFSALDVPATVTTPIAVGDAVSGSLTVPGEQHAYTFTLAADARVYLDATAVAGSLTWSLTDAVGRSINSGALDNAYWSDLAPAKLPAGTYTITVDGTNQATGAYGFTVRQASDVSTAIAIDEPVTATFFGAGDTRIYTLDVTSASRVMLDWTAATGGTTRWTLIDPQGSVRAGPSDQMDPNWTDYGPITLSPGTWTLKLDPEQDTLPSRDFVVARVREDTATVALDSVATGTLDAPGQLDRWTLHLSQPTRVYLDNVAATPWGLWSLTDPEGRVLFADADLNDSHGGDRGPWSLGAGDYTFTLRVRNGSTQSYSFSPRKAVDTSTQVQVWDTVHATIPSPGVTQRWTVDVTEGQRLVADMTLGAYPGYWTMTDAVGQTVFAETVIDAMAPVWSGTLAGGTYTFSVHAMADFTPEYEFELRSAAQDDPVFYYTQYAGADSLKRASYTYDGLFRFGTVTALASIPGADGLLVAPDGDLVIGAGPRVYKVNPNTRAVTSVLAGGANAEHLSLDPNGTVLWTSDQPGVLIEVPLVPFADGVQHPLHGDDLGVTHLAFDRRGRAFYAASGGYGTGSFGLIDMSTFTTTRVFANLPAAHGISFDPFTDTLILVGADHITQIDPETLQIVSDRRVPNMIFDQGAVDGAGHAFIASNTGDFVFVDYAATGLVGDPSAYVYARFLDTALDDVAPLSWLGSGCFSAPPIVDVSPAQSAAFVPGTVVALTGRAAPLDPTRPVVAVLINGVPADTVDAAGRFFATYTVAAGTNTVRIEAIDRCNTSRYTLVLQGDADAGSTPAELRDISASMKADFVDTTFGTDASRLLVSVRGQNVGDQPVVAPILMGVGGDLHPSISLESAEGLTVDGLPYVRLTTSGALAPSATTAAKTLSFLNPERRPVHFTPHWYTLGNHAPYFTTVPDTRASAGKLWRYDADAADTDGQAVTFSVLRGPPGLVLSSGAGVATWTPTVADAGLHEVVLVARDGFGGEARQTFSISVAPPAANTPPVFSTSPSAHVSVGASYLYDANAIDRDGDALTFALDDAPSGVTVDAHTGEVTWLFPLPGTHALSLRVSDGQGGEAWQGWSLTVGDVSTNPNGPRITSAPPLVAVVANLYFYQPVAFDPDGDTLSWELLAGPDGMTADPVTGRVLWSPTEGQAGSASVTLAVRDGFGGEARQTWTPVVANGVPNRAPVFTTQPPSVAVVGVPFSYDADAVDPEVSDVSYAKVTGPAGVSVASSTGVLSWTPAAGDAGLATLGLSAADAQGLSSSQVFYVEVRANNRAPQILSAAPARDAYAGGLWQHDVNAYDADGDRLSYALSGAPFGMTIDPTNGLISWTPTVADLGSHALTVTVTDPFGGAVVAQYAVEVVTDVTPPVAAVLLLSADACAGEPVTVCAGASDDVDVQSRGLSADSATLLLDPSGCATVLRASPVVVTFTATATDTSGNTASDVREVAFADCNNTNAPLVTLRSPAAGEAVSGPFEVVADVSDDQPIGLTWSLQISPHGEERWTEVESGVGAVSDAVLGTVDTTLLPNGDYDVRVLADDGPNFNDTRETISVIGHNQIGNFQISFTDLSVDLHGIALSITRAYDSLRVGTVGDFGAGWRLGLSGKVWDTPLEPAADADPFVSMLSAPSFQTGDHVWVERPDGRRVGFTFEPTSAGLLVPFLAAPAFTPDPGVTDTLTAVGPATIFNYGPGGWRDFILSYNPSSYILTTAEGMIYTLDDARGLLKVEDPYGNTVDVRPEGLFHSDGISVAFERDSAGRITHITEPPPATGAPGVLDYGYDAAGNLAWSEDALDHRTVYSYDAPGHPNHLTQIADPLGLPVVRTVYDADGRMTAQCGPEGDVVSLDGCSTFAHLPLSDASTVVDAVGNRTDLFYDDRGNVVLERRTLTTGGTQDIETTYDAQDNVLAVKTDGKTWTFEYDALRRMTRAVRPGGEATTWTFGPCTTFESQTDAGGNTWTVEHDAKCRESAVIGPAGDRTTYHWDAWGDLIGVDEPEGGSWTFERDAQGHPTRVVDPRGAETLQTWTSTGEMTSRTEADGRTITFGFDAAKRVVSEVWSGVGARTVTYGWDEADRLLSASDPDAVVTLGYDDVGRLASVRTAPTGGPGSVVTYTTDRNGRVTSVSDDRSGLTTYTWDALGRVSSIVQTATGTTPKRVDTTWDALSRPTQVTRYADVLGTTARLRTELGYGASGAVSQLTRVRQIRVADDAVLDAWSVTRDSRSLITSFSDEEGTHTVTLDGAARVTAIDHPVGSALPDESYVWDAAGDRIASHLSTTYVHGHDVRSGGHELDSDDTYTYLWDANGRMTHRTRRSDGQHADLVWDHRGRLTSITVRTQAGALVSSATYTYDALDRRVHVTRGGVSSWPVYDGSNPIFELSDVGAVQVRRLYGRAMDELLAEEVSGQVRWVTRDVAGNVRDLLESDGTQISRVRYDAFGRPLVGLLPTGSTLGFQARPAEPATGFVDMRARTYDPRTGRFLSPDPRLPYGYEYAVGNPLDYHDPTGRSVAIEYACLASEAVDAANDFDSTIGQGTGDLLNAVATAVATLTPPPGNPAGAAAGSVGWYLSALMGGPSGPTAGDFADAVRQKGQAIACGMNGTEADLANREAQNIAARAPQYPLGWSHGFYTITP